MPHQWRTETTYNTISTMATNALRQTLKCNCGHTQIAVNSSDVLRLVCYCKDCRGYYNTLNGLAVATKLPNQVETAVPPRPAPLDAWGGCDYTHVIESSDVKVLEGQENLEVGKIREKSGVKRFYAKCCSTPICSVGPSGTFLFNTNLIDEANKAPVKYRIIGRNALAPANSNSAPRPPMSWSVPFSWFWTMMRRMPKDKTAPLPFAVPETIKVFENFKEG
jgi:hypothetical protein